MELFTSFIGSRQLQQNTVNTKHQIYDRNVANTLKQHFFEDIEISSLFYIFFLNSLNNRVLDQHLKFILPVQTFCVQIVSFPFRKLHGCC